MKEGIKTFLAVLAVAYGIFILSTSDDGEQQQPDPTSQWVDMDGPPLITPERDDGPTVGEMEDRQRLAPPPDYGFLDEYFQRPDRHNRRPQAGCERITTRGHYCGDLTQPTTTTTWTPTCRQGVCKL